MIDKDRCDDWYIWSASLCECKCEKTSDFDEYLDYVKCKCTKRLIDQLVEKCNGDIDGDEMVYNAKLYDYELNKKVCRPCTQ